MIHTDLLANGSEMVVEGGSVGEFVQGGCAK